MAVFTRRRQGLHDMIAGTLVVRRAFSEQDVASAGPARPVPGVLIALVITAGVLFGPGGVGIMAAIATPAYQNYTIRAQVTEGLSLADACKLAISEAPANGNAPATISSQSLNLAAPTRGKYVSKIEIKSGIIEIDTDAPRKDLREYTTVGTQYLPTSCHD